MLNERRWKTNMWFNNWRKNTEDSDTRCFVLLYETPYRPSTARELSDGCRVFHRMPVYTRLHRIPEGPLKLEPYFVGETISINVSVLTFQSFKLLDWIAWRAYILALYVCYYISERSLLKYFPAFSRRVVGKSIGIAVEGQMNCTRSS
jgi:hypothetical protein